MSLRPRYSLLTLLVLTALVAGGVKLWYGPHHVVEHNAYCQEDEYTYTRDWKGGRVIHGNRIYRQFFDAEHSRLGHIVIRYFRHGKELEIRYLLVKYSHIDIDDFEFDWTSSKLSLLSDSEQKEYLDAIDQERAVFRMYDDEKPFEGFSQ